MKKGIKKFAKGMFAIFMINLFIFGSTSLFQSCSEKDNLLDSEEKIALSEFENVLFKNELKIQNFTKSHSSLILNKGEDIDDEGTAKKLLKPVLVSSQDLIMSYGFTEQDLIEEFGSLDNENLVMNALAILDISYAYVSNGGIVYNNQTNIFVQSINAQTYEDFKSCLIDAAGIAGVTLLIREGIKASIKKLGKKAVLKIIGKVVARSLGWIGAVWAVADFTNCMFDKRSQINNS